MKNKTKKFMLYFSAVAVFMMLMVFSASALEATGQCGDDVYWNYNNETGELILSGSGDMWDYDARKSPFFNSEIKSIEIENGITSISTFAFNGCENLLSVNIADSVTILKEGAFYSCDLLETINLPESLTEIGRCAIAYCYKLKNITIPDNVKIIGRQAFDYCRELKTVKIGKSVEKIQIRAFYSCEKLEKLNLPDSLKIIGDGAFSYCDSLTEIDIPDNVETIYDNAFFNCKSLKKVIVGDSVTSLPNGIFSTCTNLEKIRIGDKVTSIGISAFKNCTSLKEVIFAGTYEQWIKITIEKDNDCLLSSNTAFSSVMLPDKTACVSYTSSTKAIKLTWEPVFGADYYRIYRKTSDGWKSVVDTTATSFTIKNLSPGTKYTFAVRAGVNCSIKTMLSSYNTTVSAITRPAVTSKIKAAQNTTSIKLAWSKVAGATGYRIYKYNANTKKYEKLKDLTSTSLTIKGLSSGTKYKFKVKAFIKSGSTVLWGNYSDIFETATKPATPSLKATSTQKSKITLKWTNVSGESGYEIYYSTKKDSGYKKLSSVKANASKVTIKAASEKTYYFRVRAYLKTDSAIIYSGYKTVGVKVK